MQRIRIGLVGLAFVFMLVLFASAGGRPAQSVAPAGSQGETLATLGVAPGAEQAALRRSAEQRSLALRAARNPTRI